MLITAEAERLLHERGVLCMPDFIATAGGVICAVMKYKGATESAVRAYCTGQIAHFKIPRHIRFVAEFPMTVTSKLRRFRMREREMEMRRTEGAKA